jgi:chromosome partitioning protein
MAKKTETKLQKKTPAVVSCVNLKGGVGKTAISVNFAAYCGSKNLKVLLVDLDPPNQRNFFLYVGREMARARCKKGECSELAGSAAAHQR